MQQTYAASGAFSAARLLSTAPSIMADCGLKFAVAALEVLVGTLKSVDRLDYP
ncbi:MAG: hypothetical protein JSU86_18450 [Phycisphaerales bacterium]|nr:MAG: hypothetical protein JSU86_18450 [Phycisphaerales bacterium]